MTKVADYNIDNCISALENWSNIKPKSREDMLKVLESNEQGKYLIEELDEFYGSYEGGLDTQDRDLLDNCVAHYFTGQGWPIYGDGPEAIQQFSAKLEEAIKNDDNWELLL